MPNMWRHLTGRLTHRGPLWPMVVSAVAVITALVVPINSSAQRGGGRAGAVPTATPGGRL